jgi:oligo-1,6-glucosidase
VSRFGDDSVEHWEASAKTLATVLYLMQGTAFVYQGDEIGMRSLTLTNVEALADVASLNYYSARVREGISPEVVMQRLQRTARDHARTPMHWDDSATAGFSDGRPWYPVSSDHAWLNAAAQESQPGSVLSHYRSVIRLRKKLRVLRDGAFRLLDPDDPQTFCYERTGAGGLLRVVANFSSQPLPFSRLPAPPPWAGSASLLDTHPDHPLVGPSGGTMPPWRSFVWFQPQ